MWYITARWHQNKHTRKFAYPRWVNGRYSMLNCSGCIARVTQAELEKHWTRVDALRARKEGSDECL